MVQIVLLANRTIAVLIRENKVAKNCLPNGFSKITLLFYFNISKLSSLILYNELFFYATHIEQKI